MPIMLFCMLIYEKKGVLAVLPFVFIIYCVHNKGDKMLILPYNYHHNACFAPHTVITEALTPNFLAISTIFTLPLFFS